MYDPTNYNEKDYFDDCLSACKDYASRSVFSLVADSMEHEGDGYGLRALRTAMIPYMLNRREKQTSKYAPMLLLNKVYFMGASPRTQARIDLLACVNPTGEVGRNLARDEFNEHKVKSTKDCLRGLHSQLTDVNVSKSMLGSNVLSQIEAHGKASLLISQTGGRSSHSYFNEDQKSKIKEEIERVKPFDRNRAKIQYYDKSKGSVFSGLSELQLKRFLERNKKLFARKDPHKFMKLREEDFVIQTDGRLIAGTIPAGGFGSISEGLMPAMWTPGRQTAGTAPMSLFSGEVVESHATMELNMESFTLPDVAL